MNAEQLLTHFDRIADAPDAVPRLRRFILDLAVRGRLMPQDPNDEPASELLKRIAVEKARLVKAGEAKESKSRRDNMADEPFTLPASWQWVALGNLFLYDAGIKRDPKTLIREFWLLELEDVEKDTGTLLTRVTAAERESKSTKSEFRVDDILYGKLRPYLNKVLVADKPGYSTTEIVAIRPYIALCSRYCALALRRPDFVDYVTRLGQGTKMPRLRTEDAAVAPFPLPPLAEQHRIVAKVDELMALCDRLEAARTERETTRNWLTAASLARLNAPDADPAAFRKDAAFALDNLTPLTTRPNQVTTLRQTILNLAVRGKLVPQDPNDEPASELSERLNSKRVQLVESGDIRKSKTPSIMDEPPFDIPSSWKWLSLAEIAQFENGDRSKNYPSGSDIATAGVPFFSTKNVSDYAVKFDQMDFISEEKFQSLRSGKVRDLDILITLRGSVGKLGLFRATERFTTGFINAQLIIVRMFDPDSVYFCATFMKSQVFVDQISYKSSGSTTPQLSATQLAEVIIPLPPLSEQRRIVAKVDELTALCDRLEASLTTGEETRRRLLESVLHEALDMAADGEHGHG